MTLPQLFFLLKKHVAGSRKSLRNQSSLISQSIWSRIFYSPSLVKFLDPASPILLGSKIWLWLAKVHNKSKQFDFSKHMVTDILLAVARKIPRPRLTYFAW